MEKVIMPEQLKSAVRALREGNTGVMMDGHEASLEEDAQANTFLVAGDRKWKVEGTERLRLTEVAKAKPPKAERTPAALREKAVDSQMTCVSCGASFVKSKFNPYFDKCPDCRKKEKSPEPKAREFTCSACGEAFTVSKFQPYLFSKPEDVPICSKCSRKATRKEYMNNKKGGPQD